jgi:hypothetical protein
VRRVSLAICLLALGVAPPAAPAATITEFPIPTAEASPVGIAAGPHGALWFTEVLPNANKIGRVTTAGSFTEFAIPTADSGPAGIAAGPDGALWFTEAFANKIGRVTPAGTFTEFPIPTVSSGPREITAGPDGAMWFTESEANKIARITIEPTSKAECKDGGWRQFGFRNQGECVAFVNRGPKP